MPSYRRISIPKRSSWCAQYSRIRSLRLSGLDEVRRNVLKTGYDPAKIHFDEFFLKTCVELASLVNEHFQPKRVIRNGFACSKSFWPISNADHLLAISLKFGGNAHSELGKQSGMVLPTKG